MPFKRCKFKLLCIQLPLIRLVHRLCDIMSSDWKEGIASLWCPSVEGEGNSPLNILYNKTMRYAVSNFKQIKHTLSSSLTWASTSLDQFKISLRSVFRWGIYFLVKDGRRYLSRQQKGPLLIRWKSWRGMSLIVIYNSRCTCLIFVDGQFNNMVQKTSCSECQNMGLHNNRTLKGSLPAQSMGWALVSS